MPLLVLQLVAVFLLIAGSARPGSAQTHTLTASPDPVASGRVVYGCWTAPPGASAFDWVTLAAVDSPINSDVSFRYTGGTQSGCAALGGFVGSGSFEARYLLDNTDTDDTIALGCVALSTVHSNSDRRRVES